MIGKCPNAQGYVYKIYYASNFSITTKARKNDEMVGLGSRKGRQEE